jgi:hypothetical protein
VQHLPSSLIPFAEYRSKSGKIQPDCLEYLKWEVQLIKFEGFGLHSSRFFGKSIYSNAGCN